MNNIINFEQKKTTPKNRLNINYNNKPNHNYCKHNIIVLNEQNKTVVCKECGNQIDIFDYMIKWSEKLEKKVDDVLYLNERSKYMIKKIKMLKIEERNIKSRIKKLKKE